MISYVLLSLMKLISTVGCMTERQHTESICNRFQMRPDRLKIIKNATETRSKSSDHLPRADQVEKWQLGDYRRISRCGQDLEWCISVRRDLRSGWRTRSVMFASPSLEIVIYPVRYFFGVIRTVWCREQWNKWKIMIGRGIWIHFKQAKKVWVEGTVNWKGIFFFLKFLFHIWWMNFGKFIKLQIYFFLIAIKREREKKKQPCVQWVCVWIIN